MFNNTSKKIQVCAFIFFVVSLLNQGTRYLRIWGLWGFDSQFLWSVLNDTFVVISGYLLISLFIYGFGKLVARFETKNENDAILEMKEKKYD